MSHSAGQFSDSGFGNQPGPSQHRLASRLERLLGQFLDGMVGLGIVLALTVIGRILGGEIGILPGLSFGYVIFALYLLFADGLPGGQSLGKRVLQMKVVEKATGRPCTYWKSFVRNFTLVLLGPIDWLFIFGRDNQRLGDRIAGTIVVKTDAPR